MQLFPGDPLAKIRLRFVTPPSLLRDRLASLSFCIVGAMTPPVGPMSEPENNRHALRSHRPTMKPACRPVLLSHFPNAAFSNQLSNKDDYVCTSGRDITVRNEATLSLVAVR